MLIINMNKKALYVYIAGFNQLWNICKCIRNDFLKKPFTASNKKHTYCTLTFYFWQS